MKRAVYAILAMVLCIGMLSACRSSGDETTKPSYDLGAISDSGEHGENVKWEYYADTQTLVLSGKGEMTSEKLGEYPWFPYAENIKVVYVKSGITNIAKNSFSSHAVNTEYKNLETVYLPETLTEIGSSAFEEAIRLKDVTIPSGVVTIGESAFCGCLSLSNIMLPKSLVEVGKYAFDDCRDFHVYYEGTRDLFYKISRNGELNMQDFYFHCESDEIENKNVDERIAFAPEGDIGSITESGTCGDDERIDDLTWEFYESSGTLLIKGTGYMDLYRLNTAGEIDFDPPWGTQRTYRIERKHGFDRNSPFVIDREAFPVKQVYVMDGVNSIGTNAFAGLSKLTTAKISGSVRAIYGDAFKDCDGLSEIILSKGLEVIGDDAIPSNATVKFTGNEEDWNTILGSADVAAKEIIFNYK